MTTEILIASKAQEEWQWLQRTIVENMKKTTVIEKKNYQKKRLTK